MITAPVTFEQQVYGASDRFVTELSALSQEPHLQDAIAKMVTRDLCWGLVAKLDVSEYELADDLEVMADVLRQHAQQKRANVTAPAPAGTQIPPPCTTDLFAGAET